MLQQRQWTLRALSRNEPCPQRPYPRMASSSPHPSTVKSNPQDGCIEPHMFKSWIEDSTNCITETTLLHTEDRRPSVNTSHDFIRSSCEDPSLVHNCRGVNMNGIKTVMRTSLHNSPTFVATEKYVSVESSAINFGRMSFKYQKYL